MSKINCTHTRWSCPSGCHKSINAKDVCHNLDICKGRLPVSGKILQHCRDIMGLRATVRLQGQEAAGL
jgi:hypothetical protein